MFRTEKTFLEYILLLRGPPAVFRNNIYIKKIIKNRQLFFAAFHIKVPPVTESHNTPP